MENDLNRIGIKTLAAALVIIVVLTFIINYLVLGVVIAIGISIFYAIRAIQIPYGVVIDQNGILCRRRYLKDRPFVWPEIASVYFFNKGRGHAVIWIKNSTKQVQVTREIGKAVLDRYSKATGKQLSSEAVE